MLPKINRINKKKDFDEIFKKGKSIKDGFLIFKILENNSGKNRFGFIVSQKVAKKAVLRNKIKRRLRAVVGANMKNIKNGADIVLIALPGIEKKEFSEIQSSISKILSKNV